MIYAESKFYDGIEVRAQKPLDIRSQVDTIDDLTRLESFPYDSYTDENGEIHHTVYMKEGMVVAVKDPGDLYMLMDLSKIRVEGEWPLGGWKRLTGVLGGSSTGEMDYDGGSSISTYLVSQVINCGGANEGETN